MTAYAKTSDMGMSEKQMARFGDYLVLCKPRVVLLMLLTTVIGMLLVPHHFLVWQNMVFGVLGIGLVASGAAAFNHVMDTHIDRVMLRTQDRPIVQGRIPTIHAVVFAMVLSVVGVAILIAFVNILTAVLTLFTLVGYAVIYTVFLKHRTPQNIVIGGLAGAAPPLLGWVAMTGHVSVPAILLMLIIFVWTPPHFWALAIYRREEYAKANVPMLPVTHGVPCTKFNIVLYTVMLCAVTVLPYAIGMSGLLYLGAALLLNARFLQWTVRLYKSDDLKIAFATFRFSITYLMLLFVAFLVDHLV